ncbi:hypothetical protein CHU98_g6539 [Xylaria longipes]|nr:hypothetical protein CHU98_g6539 [Xylaria longipes]
MGRGRRVRSDGRVGAREDGSGIELDRRRMTEEAVEPVPVPVPSGKRASCDAMRCDAKGSNKKTENKYGDKTRQRAKGNSVDEMRVAVGVAMECRPVFEVVFKVVLLAH